MSRTFNVIPTAGGMAADVLASGGFARLVCRPAVSPESWPLVKTKAELAASHGMVSVPAIEIQAITFDRRHWWRWPWEAPPGERAGDDPGALGTVRAARETLDGYLLGEVNADLCVQRFAELGLALDLSDPPDPDATDDAGAEEAGSWDATDDPGVGGGRGTDDPGEAAPDGDG